MNSDNYTLSVVIPCYNEKKSIHTIVEKVLAAPIKNKEIIVVDDKSTDGTGDILDKEIAPLVSKVVHHEVNQGKGGALRTGFKTLTDDVEFCYKVDNLYSKECDRGIRFNDPTIGVDWGEVKEELLSQKDTSAPLLEESDCNFVYRI